MSLCKNLGQKIAQPVFRNWGAKRR